MAKKIQGIGTVEHRWAVSQFYLENEGREYLHIRNEKDLIMSRLFLVFGGDLSFRNMTLTNGCPFHKGAGQRQWQETTMQMRVG